VISIAMKEKLDSYNKMVNALKKERAEIEMMEKSLWGTSERMLGAVASLYGKESDEYEMAGGMKRVKRSRRVAGGTTEGTAIGG
jgi:hypothetical protein